MATQIDSKDEFEADLFALGFERYIGVRETRPNVFSASGAAGALLPKYHELRATRSTSPFHGR
jgi:hypothetical protein